MIYLTLFVVGLALLWYPDTIIAQQWSRIGNLSLARSSLAAIHIGSGRVLVIGGSTGIPEVHDPRAVPQAACEIVDVWRRKITPAQPMSVPRAEFVALLAPDSNVVVIGGVSGIDPNGSVTGLVEVYDRRTGAWRSVGTLSRPRRQHVAGFIDAHRILVVGGRIQSYFSLTDAEIFDMRTGTSTQAAPFPYPINTPTLVTSHSGELVVVGGRTGGANSERRAEVYAYDPDTDEWVLNSVLAQAVSAVSGLRLWDRRIIIAGGLHEDLPGRSATEVQLENIGKWKLISPMQAPRTNLAIAQWTENRVLAIGGFHGDRAPVATTEWIDMARHTSTRGPSLSIPRDRFTAVSVPAGPEFAPHVHAIVVIGGLSSTTALTSAVELLMPTPELTPLIERTGAERSLRRVGSGEARVAYVVAAQSHVAIEVTSKVGVVMRESSREVAAGFHDDVVDLSGLFSGTYTVRLSVAGERRSWSVTVP